MGERAGVYEGLDEKCGAAAYVLASSREAFMTEWQLDDADLGRMRYEVNYLQSVIDAALRVLEGGRV